MFLLKFCAALSRTICTFSGFGVFPIRVVTFHIRNDLHHDYQKKAGRNQTETKQNQKTKTKTKSRKRKRDPRRPKPNEKKSDLNIN